MFRNLSNFLVISFSGLVGSFIFFNVHTLLLKYIDEFENLQFDTLSYSGFFIGVTIFTITKLLKKFNLKNYPKFTIVILFTLIFLGLIGILFVVGDYTILSGMFFTIFFGVFIYIGADIFSRSNLVFFNKIKSIVGAIIGGAIAGIFISMIFVLNISFSIDEGFFFLTTFSLILFGVIIGGFIFMTISIQNLISKKEINLFSNNQILSSKKKIGVLFLIGIMLFVVTTFNYWDTLNLNDETVLYTAENNQKIFTCGKISNQSESRPFLYNKEILIDYLKSKPEQNIDILFYIYYLSNNEQDASKFKELLLDEAKNKKFVGISNSVKAWQFQAMHRAYYYDLAIEKNKELFTPIETNIILDWFKEINEHA